MLSAFARIGRASLIRGIGPKRNYKEVKECHCDACEHNGQANSAICAACKKASLRYINETNTYGPANKLSAIALKTFVYLHFLFPDAHGLVEFDARDAAEDFKCSRQSVVNSVYSLKEKGYIEYSRSPENPSHEFLIVIKGYDKLGLKANQGGRGYIVMNKNMAAAIFSCKSLNAVRVAIRVAFDTDSQGNREYTSLNEFKRFLPERYTLKDIRGFVEEAKKHAFQVADIRQPKISKRDYPITITLKEKCVGKEAYEKKVLDMKGTFRAYTTKLFDKMRTYNNFVIQYAVKEGLVIDYKAANFELEGLGYYPHLGTTISLYYDEYFTNKQIDDIAKVMVLFPKGMFERVFQVYYNGYWGRMDTEKNPAATMRLIYKNFAKREEKHKLLKPAEDEAPESAAA